MPTTNGESIRQASAQLSQALTDDLLQLLTDASKDEHKWREAITEPEAFLRSKNIALPADMFISFEEKPVPLGLRKLPVFGKQGDLSVVEQNGGIPGIGVSKPPKFDKLKKLKCVAVYKIKPDKYGGYTIVVSHYVCHFE
ncbi:hypothetical protein [Hymenobacter crusticola]|uniref:Uncharacterized protein n=1 Tax=Hymenobacter crusticola TaxID=1770526 RepID=A0A243W597_9BACT|nr:hypothetical protein [Hymenobacter crusticola]OUJ68408.1 hypothetical protein BXP70_27910 [Hymenobacter crusticola]